MFRIERCQLCPYQTFFRGEIVMFQGVMCCPTCRKAIQLGERLLPDHRSEEAG